MFQIHTIDIRYLFILMAFILLFGYDEKKIIRSICTAQSSRHVFQDAYEQQVLRSARMHARHALMYVRTYIYSHGVNDQAPKMSKEMEERRQKKMKRRKWRVKNWLNSHFKAKNKKRRRRKYASTAEHRKT